MRVNEIFYSLRGGGVLDGATRSVCAFVRVQFKVPVL